MFLSPILKIHYENWRTSSKFDEFKPLYNLIFLVRVRTMKWSQIYEVFIGAWTISDGFCLKSPLKTKLSYSIWNEFEM